MARLLDQVVVLLEQLKPAYPFQPMTLCVLSNIKKLAEQEQENGSSFKSQATTAEAVRLLSTQTSITPTHQVRNS
jgi:formaldehyde-activating enzyme involved in methanogenesis